MKTLIFSDFLSLIFCVGNVRFKEEIENMLKRRVSPGKVGRPVKENVN